MLDWIAAQVSGDTTAKPQDWANDWLPYTELRQMLDLFCFPFVPMAEVSKAYHLNTSVSVQAPIRLSIADLVS